jgi:hypothetical protein
MSAGETPVTAPRVRIVANDLPGVTSTTTSESAEWR